MNSAPDSKTLDFNALKARFWDEGFCVMPHYFASSLMMRLNGLIKEHFEAAPENILSEDFSGAANTEVVPWFPERDGCKGFNTISNDPSFGGLTAAILGTEWVSQYCMVMHSRPGSAGQAWHLDCPPEGRYFNLNRLIYTEDVDPDNGGQIVVMPRSHTLKHLPTGDPHEELPGQVMMTPKRGDVILLHGHTWHRVTPVKKRARASINFRAAQAGAPDNLTDVCVYRTMRYRFSTSEVIEKRC